VVSLFDAELGTMPGVRAAKWIGTGVGVFTALMMIALRNDRGGRDVDQVLLEGLVWLSWLVGGLALTSAAPRWFDFQGPIASLASARGLPSRLLGAASTAALVRRLWLLIGTPAVALAGLALVLTSDPRLIGARVALVPAVAVYGLLLALVLAGLTRWSAELSPRFSRTWLLIFVVGPHVARELWPSTPSVVAVFAWLLGAMSHLGTTT
jgi:hypothetical protein